MSTTANSGPPDPPSVSWAVISGRFPAGYFTTRDGQEVWRGEYAPAFAGGRIIGRPAAWSLPPELGPWPEDRLAVIIRILSLLPGASAAIVGDFLWGTWRFPSELYNAPAHQLLKQLQTLSLAESRPGKDWEEWRALMPTVPALDPFQSHPSGVRAFIDRFRLAALQARSAPRLAGYKQQILNHLARLESIPAAQRDKHWKEQYEGWRQMRDKFDQPAKD
ncbi:MAG: hypothetical protein PHE83_18195 [Opitutaceae bacterium]|nr:hypothetical protein [Opitutaceae bacterium]